MARRFLTSSEPAGAVLPCPGFPSTCCSTRGTRRSQLQHNSQCKGGQRTAYGIQKKHRTEPQNTGIRPQNLAARRHQERRIHKPYEALDGCLVGDNVPVHLKVLVLGRNLEKLIADNFPPVLLQLPVWCCRPWRRGLGCGSRMHGALCR